MFLNVVIYFLKIPTEHFIVLRTELNIELTLKHYVRNVFYLFIM